MIAFNTIDDAIYHQGFCIIDNFLAIQDFQCLYQVLQDWQAQGYFTTGKIGRSNDTQRETRIRNDQICWLEPSSANDVIQTYLAAIHQIRIQLNSSLYLGLEHFEAHFAIYSPGSFYKKHVDQFKTAQDRRISCVYYLNQEWEKEYGGELLLYDKHDQLIETIIPKANRFICFTSDLPHEVNTTLQTRYSIAGWLKVRAL